MDTPLIVCGADQTLPAAIPLNKETLALAADNRGFMPCPAGPHAPNHREERERALIAAAVASPDAELRRRAAAGLGQMASASAVDGALVKLLSDADARVRREAANAIGDALAGAMPEPRADGFARATAAEIARGASALEDRLKTETDAEAAGAMLEAIGRLRYADDAARNAAETLLAAGLRGEGARGLGAIKGLEALIRLAPRRPVNDATRARLRDLVTSSQVPRVRRLAMQTLSTLRDDHDPTLLMATLDADWQVRRLAAMRIDFTKDAHQKVGAKLATDTIFQVRYEMAQALARYAASSQQCQPLITMFDDAEPTVALRAIDLVPENCPDKRELNSLLITMAGSLGRDESRVRWHKPAHAFTTLARVSPDVAKGLIDAAEKHPAWQVRAAAATVAAQLKDDVRLVRLTSDESPNVQTAAIEGLRRMNSDATVIAAVSVLETDDYQLIRAAALAMRGAAGGERDRAIKALFGAMFRLSARVTDTSRDPRVAILERLEELLPADKVLELLPFTGDFDRSVREAATRIITAKAGKAPAAQDLRVRYPYQPSAAELAALPTTATLQMEAGGVITLELLGSEAPLTVARFAQLARLKYYDGLTFHRVVPNFVIQGGSPGASEYVGAPRYMRDEVGTVPHLRGAVGISTRGRDTGDGQIFIDLVDLPRLDHDYTVFARVTAGMDVADRVLEGAKILKVTVK